MLADQQCHSSSTTSQRQIPVPTRSCKATVPDKDPARHLSSSRHRYFLVRYVDTTGTTAPQLPTVDTNGTVTDEFPSIDTTTPIEHQIFDRRQVQSYRRYERMDRNSTSYYRHHHSDRTSTFWTSTRPVILLTRPERRHLIFPLLTRPVQPGTQPKPPQLNIPPSDRRHFWNACTSTTRRRHVQSNHRHDQNNQTSASRHRHVHCDLTSIKSRSNHGHSGLHCK